MQCVVCRAVPAHALGLRPFWMAHLCVGCLQHIRDSFAGLQPVIQALTTSYPDDLPPRLFTFDAFLWATQLWYAYALQVSGPPAGLALPLR